MAATKKGLVVTMTVLLTILAIVILYAVNLSYEGIKRERGFATAVAVRRNLRIGMSKADAESYIESAWKRYHCDYKTWSQSLYLFGDRNMETSTILVLRFKKENATEIIEMIATEEPSRLQLYERCRIETK